jgi:hypothetical protein
VGQNSSEAIQSKSHRQFKDGDKGTVEQGIERDGLRDPAAAGLGQLAEREDGYERFDASMAEHGTESEYAVFLPDTGGQDAKRGQGDRPMVGDRFG